MANPYPDAAKWTIRNDDFVYYMGAIGFIHKCGSTFGNPEVLCIDRERYVRFIHTIMVIAVNDTESQSDRFEIDTF